MTLFALDTDKSKQGGILPPKLFKTVIGYWGFSVLCFLFQLTYEYFSHGVKSNYLIFAFLIPLAGGIAAAVSFCKRFVRFAGLMRELIAGCVIWFTLGSIFRGVLEIYGTTNRLTCVFAIAGALQLAGVLITGILSAFSK